VLVLSEAVIVIVIELFKEYLSQRREERKASASSFLTGL
jgi:hypothetical protein